MNEVECAGHMSAVQAAQAVARGTWRWDSIAVLIAVFLVVVVRATILRSAAS